MSYGEYKGYHTSLDTKECMGIENLIESVDKMESLLKQMEAEDEEGLEIFHLCTSEKKEGTLFYKNLFPYGEIKLGDYHLYPTLNTSGVRREEKEDIVNNPMFIKAVMYILNYSDGNVSLEYCANRLDMNLEDITKVADILVEKKLLEKL